MNTATAHATAVRVDEGDIVQVNDGLFLKLEADGESEAIVVRNRDTGDVVVRAWRSDYVNWWFADRERSTHDLLARYRLDAFAEGARLFGAHSISAALDGMTDDEVEARFHEVMEDACDADATVTFELNREAAERCEAAREILAANLDSTCDLLHDAGDPDAFRRILTAALEELDD